MADAACRLSVARRRTFAKEVGLLQNQPRDEFVPLRAHYFYWEGLAMFNFGYGSILGILILIGDIWAIVNIFNSSLSNERKLIWIIVVALLPVLGLILWFYLGARKGKS